MQLTPLQEFLISEYRNSLVIDYLMEEKNKKRKIKINPSEEKIYETIDELNLIFRTLKFPILAVYINPDTISFINLNKRSSVMRFYSTKKSLGADFSASDYLRIIGERRSLLNEKLKKIKMKKEEERKKQIEADQKMEEERELEYARIARQIEKNRKAERDLFSRGR